MNSRGIEAKERTDARLLKRLGLAVFSAILRQRILHGGIAVRSGPIASQPAGSVSETPFEVLQPVANEVYRKARWWCRLSVAAVLVLVTSAAGMILQEPLFLHWLRFAVGVDSAMLWCGNDCGCLAGGTC